MILKYKQVLTNMESDYFEDLIIKCKGNQSLIAKMSDINRGTVRKKLEYLGLIKYTTKFNGWMDLLPQEKPPVETEMKLTETTGQPFFPNVSKGQSL